MLGDGTTDNTEANQQPEATIWESRKVFYWIPVTVEKRKDPHLEKWGSIQRGSAESLFLVCESAKFLLCHQKDCLDDKVGPISIVSQKKAV